MRTLMIATAAIVLATTAYAKTYQAGSTLTGIAHVKDGDGLSIGDIPDIRLQGIAAPEYSNVKRQAGGAESTAHLRAYVEGKQVTCTFDGTTAGRSKRPVATCTLEGKDIALVQVENGHARDCPNFSKGRYADAEAKARATRDLSAIYPLPGYCAPR